MIHRASIVRERKRGGGEKGANVGGGVGWILHSIRKQGTLCASSRSGSGRAEAGWAMNGECGQRAAREGTPPGEGAGRPAGADEQGVCAVLTSEDMATPQTAMHPKRARAARPIMALLEVALLLVGRLSSMAP